MKIDKWITDSLRITATVTEEDDSFSHDFGVQKENHIEAKDLSVFLYINGDEHDITGSISKYPIFSTWKSGLEEEYADLGEQN